MLEIKFFDSQERELAQGDWCEIICGSISFGVTIFYCQFQVTPDGSVLPFDGFAWRTINKIDKVPDTAIIRHSDGAYKYDYYYEPNEVTVKLDKKEITKYFMQYSHMDFARTKKLLKISVLDNP